MRVLLYLNQGHQEIPLKAPKALSHIEAWGIAPANRIAVLVSAESATQFRLVVLKPQRTDAGGESRFQRCASLHHASWGAAPGSPRRIRPAADWTLMCAPL